jgi:hypothetical protein
MLSYLDRCFAGPFRIFETPDFEESPLSELI